MIMKRLTHSIVEKADLNDFIINDAPLYRKELFAVTYLMEDEGAPIAYFSLANDRIGIEDFLDTTSYNRFNGVDVL